MSPLDLAVLVLYLLGLLAMGAVFLRRVKTSGQMFAAGGESPWWVSGVSAFMTLFSAATFVVWGGIAYRHGLVGVSILFSVGVGTLFVGWLLAGRWRELGVESAAEFLRLRFGPSLVQFYTWLQGTLGLFTLGGGLYALAVIVCAIVPLPEGHLLADPATGRLSVTLATLALGSLVVLITLGGGLWAVLMTDVLQFIILSASVIVVVPLLFLEVGGPAAFIAASPEGFFSPVAADFTWWFLAGWCLVHFFKLGGEWAFVQRYLCVPSRRDARKAAWLFGALFLVSPFFWMLPPMIYRGLVPDANHEQAYILACRLVLPAGMMGLMIAAMSSATASTLTTQLNVYAAAMTREVYQRYFRPLAPEAELVWAGRAFTFLLGGVVLAGALLIPRLGDYTGYIIAFTTLLTGPLVLPTIWASSPAASGSARSGRPPWSASSPASPPSSASLPAASSPACPASAASPTSPRSTRASPISSPASRPRCSSSPPPSCSPAARPPAGDGSPRAAPRKARAPPRGLRPCHSSSAPSPSPPSPCSWPGSPPRLRTTPSCSCPSPPCSRSSPPPSSGPPVAPRPEVLRIRRGARARASD